MNETCTDNRFEIIEKAKKHILEATNIDTSPEEMKVLDSFLFRCWQMGWLDKYNSRNDGVYLDRDTYELPKEDIHPCKNCDVGWGSISSEGSDSCENHCTRLKEYNEKYNK